VTSRRAFRIAGLAIISLSLLGNPAVATLRHGLVVPPVVLRTLAVPGTPAVAYAARIDPARASLALYPGTEQPPTAVPRGPASIPYGERWRLLATFNGGFKYTSVGAENGFSVDGHTYVPLTRGLGTLLGFRDGRVDIQSWRGGPTPPADVAFARQNLPLIVDNGRAVASVSNRLAWGATLGGVPAVWRTGVGIDRQGVLLYVAAGDVTAAGLASTLVRLGAVRAIELDINPEWPTFNVYAHDHGLHARMFVPNAQESPSRYLTPDSRDFFAVYRRRSGPLTVPFR
jgi:hypothetical protein